MRHASYPAPATVFDEAAARGQKTRRTTIFASVLAALHDSRRLQARRVLQQCQHLIAPPKEANPSTLIPNIGGNENDDE